MTADLIPVKEPCALTGVAAKPPAVFLSDEEAAERFLGFFTAHIQNWNTRRAYYTIVDVYEAVCDGEAGEGGYLSGREFKDREHVGKAAIPLHR